MFSENWISYSRTYLGGTQAVCQLFIESIFIIQLKIINCQLPSIPVIKLSEIKVFVTLIFTTNYLEIIICIIIYYSEITVYFYTSITSYISINDYFGKVKKMPNSIFWIRSGLATTKFVGEVHSIETTAVYEWLRYDINTRWHVFCIVNLYL